MVFNIDGKDLCVNCPDEMGLMSAMNQIALWCYDSANRAEEHGYPSLADARRRQATGIVDVLNAHGYYEEMGVKL